MLNETFAETRDAARTRIQTRARWSNGTDGHSRGRPPISSSPLERRRSKSRMKDEPADVTIDVKPGEPTARAIALQAKTDPAPAVASVTGAPFAASGSDPGAAATEFLRPHGAPWRRFGLWTTISLRRRREAAPTRKDSRRRPQYALARDRR